MRMDEQEPQEKEGRLLRLLSRRYGAETVAPSPAAEIVKVPLALVP